MSEAKAMSVIYKMTKEFPWLNYCVSICTISDVPELYDISHVFVREQRLVMLITGRCFVWAAMRMHTSIQGKEKT